MEKFEIEYQGELITVRQSSKNLFSIDHNHVFWGYIGFNGKEHKLQPGCKMPEETVKFILEEIKKRL